MDYSTLLFIDCKITCWDDKKTQPAGQVSEIISIDVAIVNTIENKISETDIILVKPTHSKVSAACERKFGIKQYMLDNAGVSFEEAYRKLRIHYMSRDRMWAAWNRADKEILENQYKLFNNLEPLFVSKLQTIQHLYCMMSGTNIDSPNAYLSKALQTMEIPVVSNNAVNVANIFIKMAKGLRPALKPRIIVNSRLNQS